MERSYCRHWCKSRELNSVHNSYPTYISCSSARQTTNRLHLLSFSGSCFGCFPSSPHPPPPPPLKKQAKESELIVYHWILKYLKTTFLQPSWQASKRVEGRERGSQGGVSLSLLFFLSSPAPTPLATTIFLCMPSMLTVSYLLERCIVMFGCVI